MDTTNAASRISRKTISAVDSMAFPKKLLNSQATLGGRLMVFVMELIRACFQRTNEESCFFTALNALAALEIVTNELCGLLVEIFDRNFDLGIGRNGQLGRRKLMVFQSQREGCVRSEDLIRDWQHE